MVSCCRVFGRKYRNNYCTTGILLSTLTLLLLKNIMASELQKVSEGNTKFSLDFYDKISSEKGNIFVSPFSIHAVLSLLHAGAKGETATALAKTLHVADSSVAQKGYKELITALNNITSVTLKIANKVYGTDKFSLSEEYKKKAIEQFLAEIETVDFSQNAKTAGIINEWVENKTNKKIKDLISEDDLNKDTSAVLVNAIYFKGNWAKKFDPNHTKTEPFYLDESTKVDCQMMHLKGKFNYGENDELDATILEMPYEGSGPNSLSMVFILPNSKSGLPAVEKKLKNFDFSKLNQVTHNCEVEVSIPKFKMEYSVELNDILTDMGLGIIFDKPDFSPMFGDIPMKISKAIQKAFIEVNEEGSEAAAATGLMMMAFCAMPMPPDEFRADHPFIIVVYSHSQKILLFEGRVADPVLT